MQKRMLFAFSYKSLGLGCYLLFLLACPQSTNYGQKRNIPLSSNKVTECIHNTTIQLVYSSSQPSFRGFSGNHSDSLLGMRTCWQSRNWCICAFSLYTTLHVLTLISPSRKCRLRPLQWIYHLSGIFSLWQATDTTSYKSRSIVESVGQWRKVWTAI